MFKTNISLILVCSLIVSSQISAMNQQPDSQYSTTKKVIIGGTIGVGVTAVAVVAAPYVLPAGALVALKAVGGVVVAKATAAFASAKGTAVAAGPVIKIVSPYVSMSIYAGRTVKKEFFPTTEQKVQQLRIQEALEKPFEQQLKELSEKMKREQYKEKII